jgi:hypothetical protein
MFGLIASVHLFPSWWPLVAALSGAAIVFVVTFLAPVLLEPVFNRFAPLRDDVLAGDLRRLADQAGVPVRDVLVADASRRTTKHNAYVSGIGRTRRVVVWDTSWPTSSDIAASGMSRSGRRSRWPARRSSCWGCGCCSGGTNSSPRSERTGRATRA